MKPHTRVKICGITRLDDALAAVAAGADALGFVFYAKSPRWIEPEAARAIAMQLPPFVATVGLFVDAPLTEVERVSVQANLSMVQFHGAERGDYCAQCSRPYIKAAQMKPGFDYTVLCEEFAAARGILVDTYHPELAGGTGQTFDWSCLPALRAKPLILAGGLNARNVGHAIALTRPYAVDVSGGVESRKGIKDTEKIREFIAEVARVECND